MLALLALALLQDLPSEAEADEALRTFKNDLAGKDAPGRIAAVQKAVETPHERVLRAVGAHFATDTEEVRIAVAAALADVDHPAAVEALLHGLPPNEKRPEVVAAIVASLAELGWQSACPALEAIVRRAGVDHVRDILPPVLEALGRLGSATSVDPLLDLLKVLEGRVPWKGEGDLKKRVEKALGAIAGYLPRNSQDFEVWWKANRPTLMLNARRLWWSKRTGERCETGSAEKSPAESQAVAVRLVDPPTSRPAKTKKKPK